MTLSPIIFIVGPTAVGKSEIAFLLAQKIQGEIVSCDAMQVYREISIASSKPSSQVLRKVPHHLIDTVSIEEDFDVAVFNQEARKAIRCVHKHKKVPIVVGGSGLYMSVLLDGIFEGGARDPQVRQQLEEEVGQKGSVVLHRELERIDSDAAARIHPHDAKRIVRALEVYRVNKVPISSLQKSRKGLWGKYAISIFALNRDRQELYQLVNQRVDAMLDEGLVQEIKKLQDRPWSTTAAQLIGVKEIRGYLQGKHTLEHAAELIKLHSRRYAKRQLTWFRKDKRLQWILLEQKDTPLKIASKIQRLWENKNKGKVLT